MKCVLEARKLCWLINAVLISILVYIIAGFIPGDYSGKKTFANSIPKDEKENFTLSTDSTPVVNHKIIIERNIFRSSERGPANGNLRGANTETATSVIKSQFRLAATIAGDDEVACAVIENLKSKVQDIYKAGDIIDGVLIESIDRNKIVLLYVNKREVLNLHITREVLVPVEKSEEPVIAQSQKTAEFVNVISPTEREINRKACVRQIRSMEVFLEKMDLTPYVVNGEEKGLCITGLDDLVMARYFGFEDGDVIQTINGQMLTDKQKAFQVLKKARSQSSLNFQLLRNEREMGLSFEIK